MTTQPKDRNDEVAPRKSAAAPRSLPSALTSGRFRDALKRAVALADQTIPPGNEYTAAWEKAHGFSNRFVADLAKAVFDLDDALAVFATDLVSALSAPRQQTGQGGGVGPVAAAVLEKIIDEHGDLTITLDGGPTLLSEIVEFAALSPQGQEGSERSETEALPGHMAR